MPVIIRPSFLRNSITLELLDLLLTFFWGALYSGLVVCSCSWDFDAGNFQLSSLWARKIQECKKEASAPLNLRCEAWIMRPYFDRICVTLRWVRLILPIIICVGLYYWLDWLMNLRVKFSLSIVVVMKPRKKWTPQDDNQTLDWNTYHNKPDMN